jgi:[ribosomal protein S18]-alanine N-acetyltransferase
MFRATLCRASQYGLSSTIGSILVRPGLERDFLAIARIQYHCPETAQWPLGDYAAFPVLVALIDTQPAGFCCWRQSAPDEAEILNLAVDPAWRRRGVGSALLTAVADRAKGVIFLEVAEPNAAAIALYRKHGWVETGLRPGYYNHGTVNAVVMKKRSW